MAHSFKKASFPTCLSLFVNILIYQRYDGVPGKIRTRDPPIVNVTCFGVKAEWAV